MKLYRWDSEAMRQYAPGDILALGRDVDEARAVARTHFDRIATAHYADMMQWFDKGEWEPDEDDIERRDKQLRLLEADIMKEPEVSDAFFLSGSE